jgi:hypothetical protein
VHTFNAITIKDCLALLFHHITPLSFWAFVLCLLLPGVSRRHFSVFPLPSTIRLRSTRSTTITDWNPKYILKNSRVGGNISFKECILYPKLWIRGSLIQIAAEQHQRHRSGDTASISKFSWESLSSFETILVSR